MLVIANGANKCGSTWLASIVFEIVQPKPLPSGFHDARHGSVPTIRANMIRQFLDEVDYEHENYVSKNHFFYERQLISKYKHVYVLDIQRDMADMLISLFFHSSPRMGSATPEQVRQAYWQYGPPIIEYVARYHAVWSKPCSWSYTSSYERLKANPGQEISAIASFIGMPLTSGRVAQIVENTQFKRLAERLSGIEGMERRFRKGVVGDHKHYFDPKIVEHIRKIESLNAGYPRGPFQKASFAWACHKYSGRDQVLPYQAKLAANRQPTLEMS